MIRFYGNTPPAQLRSLFIGGKCPHCDEGTRFTLQSKPDAETVIKDNLMKVIAGYSCDICLEPIPVVWNVHTKSGSVYHVSAGSMVLKSREIFDFDYLPESVKRDIEEALDCLSVGAHNGFAALCRRSVQSICEDIGAEGSTKVQRQIKEMLQMTGLGEDWEKLATQIMLTGHDGAHPHLPEVNAERSAVLLSLLQDLTFQLYTRPGKVKEAAALRIQAIEQPS